MNKSVPPTKNFLLSGGNWIACTPPPLHNAAYMNIRILSDGKQGHLNQSLGLAQALISKAGGTVETVNLQGLSLLGKIRKVVSGSDIPRPDLFISAGHATHIPLICARHHFKTRAILCMKPTLPCSFFDLCLIPRHDLDSGRDYTDTNIFPTQGALHPMRPDTSVPKDTTLILIGGPSKDFDWDDESMLNQLASISIHTPGDLVLTTSRRTPDGFAEKIRTAVPELTVVPVEETRPGWVARHLAHASAAWVSQDSVSMVYEALGSGAPVGILSVPRRHGSRKSRILSGLETLEKEGMVTGYSDWKNQNFRLTAPGSPLLEADRAADYILSRHILMPIGKKSISTLFRIGALRALLQAVRPDILHLHSRVPAWAGYLAWKKLPPEDRPGLVTSVHGFYSVNRYSAIMSRGERVIAVSNCIRDYILDHYPSTPPDHIRIIPNAISPDQYHPAYSPSREWLTGWFMSYPELKGKFTLCLPGRITRLKGHLDLIPVVRQLLEQGIPAHAVIVGEAKKGKEEYKNEVLRAIERSGVSQSFTWTGHRQDLREILSTCSVTLSLTKSPEAFGKSTLEALALGKPVAGYAHGGVKEQLDAFLPEGNVAVGNTAAMADLLARWHAQPPPLPRQIPSPYNMQDMIQAHLDVYQELTPYS